MSEVTDMREMDTYTGMTEAILHRFSMFWFLTLALDTRSKCRHSHTEKMTKQVGRLEHCEFLKIAHVCLTWLDRFARHSLFDWKFFTIPVLRKKLSPWEVFWAPLFLPNADKLAHIGNTYTDNINVRTMYVWTIWQLWMWYLSRLTSEYCVFECFPVVCSRHTVFHIA